MTLYEQELVASAYCATKPWNSIDASRKPRHKEEDQAQIDKCFNCPFSECYNCLTKKAIPKYIRFVMMFELSNSMEDICRELKISRTSYFNYKKKLLKGVLV